MKFVTVIVIVIGVMILITLIIELTNITQSPKNRLSITKNKKCFKLINIPKNKTIHIKDLVDYLEKTPYKHQLIPFRKGSERFQKHEKDILIIGKMRSTNKVLAFDFLAQNFNKYAEYTDLFEFWMTFTSFY